MNDELSKLKQTLAEGLKKAARLNAATDRLNEVITLAEAKLKECGFGVSGTVAGWTGGTSTPRFLGFQKYSGEWRLVAIDGTPNGIKGTPDEVRPLVNAPRSIRLQLVPFLPALVRELVANIDEEIQKVGDSIEAADSLIADLKKGFDAS